MRILIFGCGYVGLSLGGLLARCGHSVVGVRRRGETDPEMLQSGITPLHLNISNPIELGRVDSTFDLVVNLVSSSKGGVDEYRQVYLEGTKNILSWLSKSPPRAYLYTSSTSVYAQADGSWVTEDRVVAPASPTSQVLVETERELLTAYQSTGFPVIILRASGIYGPERGYLFKQFIRGEATLREDDTGVQSFINMIHVADLAAAIAHLFDRGVPGEIYNATDDEPVTQFEFFKWLSTTLAKPMPPSAPPDPNRKRGLTSKRVSNAKLKSTGFKFQYPTFREGYAAEIQRLSLKGGD